MIDNKQTENIDFSSPTTIIIIVLIFIIIILIFTMDTFGNTNASQGYGPQLPQELINNIVFNYVPNNISKFPVVPLNNTISIYIVCQFNSLMDKSPYCLLDLDFMSINKNNIVINGKTIKYSTIPLNLFNTTIISCIIKNSNIVVHNYTTQLMNETIVGLSSNPFKNVSVGKTLSETNPFNGTINKVLIYNTAVTPIQHNSILLNLASNYGVSIPKDFTQMNVPYVGSHQPSGSTQQPSGITQSPCTIS